MPGRLRQLPLWNSASQICLFRKYKSGRDTVFKNKVHGSRGMIPEVVLSLYTHAYAPLHTCVHMHAHIYRRTCKHVHTYTHNVSHLLFGIDKSTGPSQSPQASCCFREARLWSTAPRIHPSVLSSASLSAPISGHLCNPAACLCTN